MGYVVNETVTDSIILRDGTAAIPGLTLADFATAEARLVGSAQTVTLSLAYVSDATYDIAFTPDAVGTWQVHLVYDDPPIFKELMGTYDIDPTAGRIEWGDNDSGLNYATLDQLKQRLNKTSDSSDAMLLQILASASRVVDGQTNRFFYQVTDERIYSAEFADTLAVDDLVSISSLVTDDLGDRSYNATWNVTDYDLEPYSAAAKGMPYTTLGTAPNGRYLFPRSGRGVKISGVWGWPTLPSAITEATLIMAVRLAKRVDAPYGIAGTNELGQANFLPRVDPDVRTLLEPYRRFTIGAV